MKRIILLLCFILLHIKSSSSKLHKVDTVDDAKELKKYLRTKSNILVAYVSKETSGSDWHPILDEASDIMTGRATIVRVICGEAKKVCKSMKVSPSPISLVHYKDGKVNKEYDRKKTVKSMVSFLEDPTGDVPWSEDEGAHDVVHIDTFRNFQTLVKNNLDKKILIMFYAPWCGHCKRMKPEFAGAATVMKKNAIFVGVDVDKPSGAEFNQVFNISGYPTLYFIENGAIRFEYGGERDKDGFVKWMNNPTESPKSANKDKAADWSTETSDVVFLNDDNFKSTILQNPSVLVMFYTPGCGHCQSMKPDYTAAASKLKESKINGILAALDASKAETTTKEFGIKGYPTLKYFKNGEYEYDINDRTEDKLLEFMKDPKKPVPPPEEKAWKDTPSAVVHPGADEFKAFLKKKKHVLVMYYAPWCGHCKKAKPEFTAAAEILKDNNKVAFAAVDCTAVAELCQSEQVSGYPTLKHYNYGKSGVEYSMGREEEDFVAFMQDPFNPKKPGQKRHWKSIPHYESLSLLDADNFAEEIATKKLMMVMFYAPWCGHCTKMKPDFAQAAADLKSTLPGVGLGALDATEENSIAEQYAVKGFPTLIVFTPDGEYSKYSGDRTAKGITEFMTEKIAEMQKKDEDKKRQLEAAERQKQEESRRKKEQEMEAELKKKKLAEEAEEKKRQEAKAAEEKKLQEEKKRQQEAEEKAKKQRQGEEARKQKAAEEQKKQEQAKADEMKRKEEEQAKAKQRQEEESRKQKAAEEQKKQQQAKAEQLKKANEAKGATDSSKKAATTGVLSLVTAEDFKKHVASGSGRALVLFYRPSTDPNYKTPMKKAETAAEDSRVSKVLLLAQVNCDQNVDLCDSEGIASSPIFRFYSRGQFKEIYNAKVAPDALLKYVEQKGGREDL